MIMIQAKTVCFDEDEVKTSMQKHKNCQSTYVFNRSPWRVTLVSALLPIGIKLYVTDDKIRNHIFLLHTTFLTILCYT